MLDPVAVGLKFGFVAVLYIFLVWVARSALRDLRGSAYAAPSFEEATGMHQAGKGISGPAGAPRLRVESAPGLQAGAAYDLRNGAVLGRGDHVDVVLEDTFSSSRHASLTPHGDTVVLEDLGSTNGTFLNGEPLTGPQPLHDGDRIRIGDSEFTFER